MKNTASPESIQSNIDILQKEHDFLAFFPFSFKNKEIEQLFLTHINQTAATSYQINFSILALAGLYILLAAFIFWPFIFHSADFVYFAGTFVTSSLGIALTIFTTKTCHSPHKNQLIVTVSILLILLPFILSINAYRLDAFRNHAINLYILTVLYTAFISQIRLIYSFSLYLFTTVFFLVVVVFFPSQMDLKDFCYSGLATVSLTLLMLAYIERNFRQYFLTNRIAEFQKQQLDILVNSDALTRVANRRFFNSRINQEWLKYSLTMKHLSLLLIDIDYFKDYNDFYGHLQGDIALTNVAQCLQANLKRETDVVCRFGGEEFIVILPDADVKTAQLIAERLRIAVATLKIPHTSLSANDTRVITISIGCATATPKKSTLKPQDLTRLADEALYHAKKNGRNRVEVSGNHQ